MEQPEQVTDGHTQMNISQKWTKIATSMREWGIDDEAEAHRTPAE
jgi:hypothetical protein